MLSAVLFDLDGTLVELDGEGFLDTYLEHAAAALRPDGRDEARALLMAAGLSVFAPHPGRSNGEAFRGRLAELLCVSPHVVDTRLAEVDAAAVGQLRFPYRRVAEARACVQGCLRMGLRVGVATTPIYRPEIIQLRLRWAGLEDLPWALITHSENMQTCKPDPAYFAEAAALLGLRPEECLLVGDDALQDGPAQRIGMDTLLISHSQASEQPRLCDVLSVAARRLRGDTTPRPR